MPLNKFLFIASRSRFEKAEIDGGRVPTRTIPNAFSIPLDSKLKKEMRYLPPSELSCISMNRKSDLGCHCNGIVPTHKKMEVILTINAF